MVDGVVLLDAEQDDERATSSGDFSKPCIAISYPQAHEGCACVDIDFAEAGRKVVDFLFDKGRRKVAFLRNNEADYECRSGYVVIFRESMLSRAKERGMTVVESSRYKDDRFDAIRFVRETFADEDRPTAIINQANVNVLNWVLQELSVAGLSEPEDVSVLSCGTYFDGELMMSRPITEMPVMPEKLCLQAMGLLVSAIEQGVKIKGDVELEAPAVKLRGSVAEINPGERTLKVASR
ncbi:substrate-binding domain-containing protein [Bifidobacterium catenulatum subsp. kashiwanohense]|uniref:substrate-binding domain-containing protein n=1 Tax=Bifidobacterium catenulatum TaxID=1686 RepID=UPI003D085EC4